ncbi:MAG: mannose-6-phosphate isomerase, partial [Peptostreptococcaceae bacterium]
FSLYSVINGEGSLECNNDNLIYSLKKGDHFILPSNIKEFNLDGNIELICSHI